jgi:L-ascorbate metabolism protein UlaG (beta-lactamase superfamily)
MSKIVDKLLLIERLEMNDSDFIKYYGWSAIEVRVRGKSIFFDPFYRPYCGAQWFDSQDFSHADVVCVTHGHEEHFLDVPQVVRNTGAQVVATSAVCRFLERRSKIPGRQLLASEWGGKVRAAEVDIALFPWKHRDINLFKAMSKAVFSGNTTQLSWAWSSATNAPFYAGYTGFHLTLPDGMTVLNYNEGFNTKTTEADLQQLHRDHPRVDVLLAGMQLFFIDDVVRGVKALSPKLVVLYPPHEKFHEMMEVKFAPWADFASAVQRACPQVQIVIAEPGTVVQLSDFSTRLETPRLLAA